MNFIKYFLLISSLLIGNAAWAKNCVKGIPCGRSCIAAWKTCHIDSGYPSTAAPVSQQVDDSISNKAQGGQDGEKFLVVAMNGNQVALKNSSGKVRGWTIFCRGNARYPGVRSLLEVYPGNLAITSDGDACSIYR